MTEWLPLTSAIATMVSATAAWAAVFVVGRQVREMRRLREEQARPFVVVRLKLGRLVSIVVENVGPAQARDVRFSFAPPLTSTSTSSGGPYPAVRALALQEGLESLAPGDAFEFVLDASADRFKRSDLPMRIEASATYHQTLDGKLRRYTDTYVLDLQSLGFATLPTNPLDETRKELAKIAGQMKGLNEAAARVSRQLERET